MKSLPLPSVCNNRPPTKYDRAVEISVVGGRSQRLIEIAAAVRSQWSLKLIAISSERKCRPMTPLEKHSRWRRKKEIAGRIELKVEAEI